MIFHIQFTQTIGNIVSFILILQSLLRSGKNVSLPLIKSTTIQVTEIKIRTLVIIARGFINNEFKNCPLNNSKVALVEPQAGQGIPVIPLKTQNVCIGKYSNNPDKRNKYPAIKDVTIARYSLL